jgi:FtsZ-binding cell division protein ZapB
MDTSFDRLEEKVRKAADVVKRLRKENADLLSRLGAAEKKEGASAETQKQLEGLERELKALRNERTEVKERIARLVEVLDNLE